MSKEKIEELAEDIFLYCRAGLLEDDAKKIAEFVIDKRGYRKQSENATDINVGDKVEWISVDGYERYSINEYGIVKNNETGMILLPTKNKAGYLTVCLYNEVKKTVRIHRLVAQAFIPNPENKPFINHKNGIKTDNRVCNLEWVTSSENNLHKCRVLGKKSTNEPNPKIAVRCVETGETFKSMSDASKKYKTQPIHISECCRGKRKTAGGLHWMPLPEAPKMRKEDEGK